MIVRVSRELIGIHKVVSKILWWIRPATLPCFWLKRLVRLPTVFRKDRGALRLVLGVRGFVFVVADYGQGHVSVS